jgi:hypothetical protein
MRTRKSDIEDQIILHCEGDNGFLMLCTICATFDNAKYEMLLESLDEYSRIIRDDVLISRRIANCLFQLETGLSNAIAKYEESNNPQVKLVEDAHATIWLKILEVLGDISTHNR